MSLEQRPVAALNRKEADYQAKISAYGNISGALSGFQTTVQELTKIEKFQGIKATSSDTTALIATASAKAPPGKHSLSIETLAQAQKLSTPGLENDVTSIGTGVPSKLTFDFGTISGGTLDAVSGKYKEASFNSNGQGIKTITIDSNNNTLQGIRDAINSAKMGVTASIINNGNSENPYSLALNSSNQGLSNSLKISVEGDETLSNLLAHDPSGIQNLTQNSIAQDAKFKIDGVSVSKTSNSVTDVLPGVTLELAKVTEAPVSLSVTRDNAALTTSVEGFVKAFNDLNKTLQDLTSYNPATKEGALLQGDSTVRLLQSQMRAILNTPINNSGSSLNTLSQIGITVQRDGNMALDTSLLEKAIEKNASDVASLFTTVGQTSDPMISYSSAGPATDAGAYPVNITSLATQGSLGGCEEIESLVIEKDENDQLNVTVDGEHASITLAPGEYSYDGLATEMQSKINGAGRSVSVKHDEYGYIITSNSFGSKSKVEVTGNAALNIFGQRPVIVEGKDVEGTINGTPAEGSGKTLISKDGVASGIKVEVQGGKLGERGKLNYSQGYANKLNEFITSVLAKDGQLESRKSGINSSIKDVGRQRSRIEQRLPQQEARFRKQYSTLETTLSNMGKTSNYLNQQLANLPRPY
jgi:flagellar hook-associated protein 2